MKSNKRICRYYPPGSGVPWATIVGSANLGERSVRRDLEAQAAIFTVSAELQVRIENIFISRKSNMSTYEMFKTLDAL